MSENIDIVKSGSSSNRSQPSIRHAPTTLEQTTQNIIDNSVYFQQDRVIRTMIFAFSKFAEVTRNWSKLACRKLQDIKLERSLDEKVGEMKENLTQFMSLTKHTNKPLASTHIARVYERLADRFRNIAKPK